MKIGKIGHAGIIVNNVEEAANHYSALFGIKHWYELVSTSPLELYYHGERKNCDVTIWYGGKGHTAMELIQTRGDRNAYNHFLDNHGEGIHHLQYYVKDLDKAIEESKKLGLIVVQRARFMSKSMEVKYAYVAKSESSAAFELIEATLPGGIKKGDMPCELLLGRLTGNFKRVK